MVCRSSSTLINQHLHAGLAMSLPESLALMGVGIVLLLAGAEVLVRGAAALALRFGLTPLVVGLTVVAFGTSSPELVVSIEAALAGDGGFAIGNVVGSNVANLALIVGLSATLSPIVVQKNLLRWDLPVVLGSAVLLVLFLLNKHLSRMEGAVLAAGLVIYLVLSIRASRRDVRAEREVELPEEVEEFLAKPNRRIGRYVLLSIGGLALLLYGADRLLEGAIGAAARLGVSEAVIGLTVVAFGTSLPELATTVVAAVRKQGDIALGNAIGSNVFNTLGVLGPAALVAPMNSGGVATSTLLIMLAVTGLTFAILWISPKTRRWEGFCLMGVYVFYLWWVIPK